MFSRSDLSFLKGACLGDGCLRKVGPSTALLQISHSVHQSGYMDWKVDRLNRMLGSSNVPKPRQVSVKDQTHHAVQWWSLSREELLPLWKQLYPQGRKRLTPLFLRDIGLEGLAVLYMDDGNLHLRKRGCSQAGIPYVRERIVELALYVPHEVAVMTGDWIESLTGASFQPRIPNRRSSDQLWNLRASGTQARRFVEALQPYGCTAMAYKFDLQYETRTARGKAHWSEADRENYLQEADKVTRARGTQTGRAVGDEIVYAPSSSRR